ncbi:hypothetical protein OJAV_G00234190 [Oryzias javanicus]|uniref:UTP25 NTP hydrolase-like domain-containing protein n=1 Tax=Oryzias javanicus TaxID=123683 RepID=A0A437BYT5_ORYJA|nr:hypothetical protein OJAV_G00234190 [Oryzias javanicus]
MTSSKIGGVHCCSLFWEQKEKREDFDSLSFIELLVVDHSDIFLMQNWEHVLQVHLHLLDSFLVDSSRVRTWNLNTRADATWRRCVFSFIQDPQIDNTHQTLFQLQRTDGIQMFSSLELR